MRINGYKSIAAAAALLSGALLIAPAWSSVTTDRAAAILVFPRVLANKVISLGADLSSLSEVDTIIQITNTTNDPVSLHCFYTSAVGTCSFSGDPCTGRFNCPLAEDICVPGWTETDFDVILTGQQPVAWRASTGLPSADFPLDGNPLNGPTGQNNVGSAVPPVAVGLVDRGAASVATFEGELRCIVVDGSGQAIPNNAIKGEASVITLVELTDGMLASRQPAVEKYNGIGIPAIGGDADDDGVLILGGDAGEYDGCPNVLIVDHFFDFAPISPIGTVVSYLTLVPCSANYREQIPGAVTAQYLVFNEFEQRFSTSRGVNCYFNSQLSRIDTPNEDRSIFNANVAGTASGQTRVRGVQGGLLGVVSESAEFIPLGPLGGVEDSFNVHIQGDREQPDRIIVP